MDAIMGVIRDFVERKRGKLAQGIGPNTALLRDGYLDSFALVELIAELEKEAPGENFTQAIRISVRSHDRRPCPAR